MRDEMMSRKAKIKDETRRLYPHRRKQIHLKNNLQNQFN